jgi:hypothetical protein
MSLGPTFVQKCVLLKVVADEKKRKCLPEILPVKSFSLRLQSRLLTLRHNFTFHCCLFVVTASEGTT